MFRQECRLMVQFCFQLLSPAPQKTQPVSKNEESSQLHATLIEGGVYRLQFSD